MLELFKTLPKETQKEVKDYLKAYDSVTVEYFEGKYHVTTSSAIQLDYPQDFQTIARFYKKDIYTKDEQRKNFQETFGYKPIW